MFHIHFKVLLTLHTVSKVSTIIIIDFFFKLDRKWKDKKRHGLKGIEKKTQLLLSIPVEHYFS